ncbi:hypothetical protein F443_13105, partial [Phytophthora nicotianae P1569]
SESKRHPKERQQLVLGTQLFGQQQFHCHIAPQTTTTTAPPSTTAPKLNKYSAASSNCRFSSNYNPVTSIYSYSTDHDSTVSI